MGTHIPLRAVPDAGNFLRIPCVWIETWPRGHDGVLAVSGSQRVLVGGVDASWFFSSLVTKIGTYLENDTFEWSYWIRYPNLFIKQWENGELIWIEHGLNSFCLGMVYISCSWRTSSHSHFKFAGSDDRLKQSGCSILLHDTAPPLPTTALHVLLFFCFAFSLAVFPNDVTPYSSHPTTTWIVLDEGPPCISGVWETFTHLDAQIEASIGALGQHFLRFPGFEKTQWGEQMPSGFLAAFSNPGTHWGNRQPCILHKRMQPKMFSTGGKRLRGDVGKDFFNVSDDADDDHSLIIENYIIGTYRNIASLHPSLNLHSFTFFFAERFLRHFWLGFVGASGGCPGVYTVERGFFDQGTGELWRSLESRTVHGGVVTPTSGGCWHGRVWQKHSTHVKCQSGKAVKFDEITNDVRWYRPPQKWVWMGKLFKLKEKPQTMQESPVLQYCMNEVVHA